MKSCVFVRKWNKYLDLTSEVRSRSNFSSEFRSKSKSNSSELKSRSGYIFLSMDLDLIFHLEKDLD